MTGRAIENISKASSIILILSKNYSILYTAISIDGSTLALIQSEKASEARRVS